MILSKSNLREKIMCIYKVSQRGLSEGQGSPGKIAGYKKKLLNFWDIKVLLGCLNFRGGGGDHPNSGNA